MRIAELAMRSGLSTLRIRLYEAKGLLNAVSSRANRYREYLPDSLMRSEVADIARMEEQLAQPLRERLFGISARTDYVRFLDSSEILASTNARR